MCGEPEEMESLSSCLCSEMEIQKKHFSVHTSEAILIMHKSFVTTAPPTPGNSGDF